MEPSTFLLLAFGLACTLGPLVGLAMLLLTQRLRRADRHGFLLTIGLPPHPRARKQAKFNKRDKEWHP